jgi:hypothetical protein
MNDLPTEDHADIISKENQHIRRWFYYLLLFSAIIVAFGICALRIL